LKDGPLKKRPSGLLKSGVGPLAGVLAFFLLAVSLFCSSAHAQAVRSESSLRIFTGTYKEQASGKTLRIEIEDDKLTCRYADGATLVALHLLRSGPTDDFDIEETNTRQKISFQRNRTSKVVGLKFGSATYVRDADSVPANAPVAITSPAPFPGASPVRMRPEFVGKTGDFGEKMGKDVLIILERSGKLYVHESGGNDYALSELSFTKKTDAMAYTFASPEDQGGWVLAFEQHGTAPIWQIATQLGPYERLPYSVPTGSNSINLVKPLRGLKEIRAAAMAATPPEEKGTFRKFDLVELRDIDPAIRLDIRYATPNDFLGTAVYTQARAFLQRPAAEALVRAVRRLQPLGFGLLIHDGYRPWYVTKIFWDATPESGKIFVADPAQGSRHNRGCAVDLTLYDLKTNEPVEMTSLYDEMSPRAFPDYLGGTSLQRWRRDLLRWAMEAEGFTVYESEWWHFDYKDWREYAIGNVAFEKLGVGQK
jgi:D-alanyl-D-alanine dipeptidase